MHNDKHLVQTILVLSIIGIKNLLEIIQLASYHSLNCERVPMSGAPYIRFKHQGGLTFEVSTLYSYYKVHKAV